MKERHKTNSAVFLILLRKIKGKNQILLQFRQNTGYMDNMWDMAVNGHIENGERLEDALIRETKEEIGIDVNKSSLELITFDHKEKENYYNFFFICNEFKGTPTITEQNKCAKLEWFDIDNLPDNLIEHDKKAINRLQSQKNYEIK